jgi:hypothetical protein
MPKIAVSFLAKLAAAGFLALAVPAASASAQGAQQAQPKDAAPEIEPQQVQLTAPAVERFLASWKDLDDLRAKLDKQEGAASGPDDEEEGDPLFALGAYLDKPKAKAEIDKALAKHGFANYAEWANVAQSVMLAFGAADPQSGPIDLEAEKARVIEEIAADKTLSAEDKKQALAALDEQFAALADFQPLPGNVDVVKPYLDKIREIFDDQPQ